VKGGCLVERELSEKKRFVTEMLDIYSDMVYRLSFLYLKNKADAEDAVQEVFIRLFKTDNHFNDDQHVKAWLLRVTANYCRSIIKSPWHKRVMAVEDIIAKIEDKQKRNVVSEVLALPDKYRDVIYLFYYEGYGCF